MTKETKMTAIRLFVDESQQDPNLRINIRVYFDNGDFHTGRIDPRVGRLR